MAELTEVFDYLVLGTDTSSSILAAALAQVSRKVIHLDSPSYFGSTDASLNFTELERFLRSVDTLSSCEIAPTLVTSSCSSRTIQVQAVNPK